MRWPDRVAPALLCLALAAGGCGRPAGQRYLPPSRGPWRRDGPVRHFTRANLYEHIDGEAPLVFSFGFRSLAQAAYRQGARPETTVDIYDMGSALNAFGMYHRERPKKAAAIQAGAEAAAAPPYQCLLLKDRYYLKVETNKGKLTEEICKTLLGSLAKALPGSEAPPDALKKLPSRSMVPGSAAYTKKSYLALSELEGCLHAAYQGKGEKNYRLFTMVLPDAAAALEVWKKLAQKWKLVKSETRPVLTRSIPYRGLVAITLTDQGIFGVVDAPDARTALTLLGSLGQP